MRRHERDLDLIEVILDDYATLISRLDRFHLDKVLFCDDRSEDGELAYDAVMSPVYRIAEDALHLSEDVMGAYPNYPWNAIRGFRNFVAHGYREVDRPMAWRVITCDLPELVDILTEYAEDHSL